MKNDRERAKEIIVEIVRQAGGAMDCKTAVFKAFYHAHLRFADMEPNYLSGWPIVRMPRGPGIHGFCGLLVDLIAEKRLSVEKIGRGSHHKYRFVLQQNVESNLSPEAVEAIKFGVKQVAGKTAAQISDESHKMSRSWRQSQNGEELHVYLDLLSDDEYDDYSSHATEVAAAVVRAVRG